MAYKKTRNAEIVHVGRTPKHRYERRNGVETAVGVDQLVQVSMRITDLGPEYHRDVIVQMTRAEAMEHIRRLSDAVQATRDAELDHNGS